MADPAPGSYRYDYPRPAVTVDTVVFGLDADELQVLLIERAIPPYQGQWAFPGGFIHIDEPLEAAARRELEEETGLTRLYLEQLGAWGTPGRDPRGRTISVVWLSLVRMSDHRTRAATDARAVGWHPADSPPPLAFDHAVILDAALRQLRERIRREPIGVELLPPEFTLPQLQRMYEVVSGRLLDKRNFRRKVQELGLLVDTGNRERGVPRRPARLYRFDRTRYESLRASGIDFEVQGRQT